MEQRKKIALQLLGVLMAGYIIGALFLEGDKSIIDQGYEDGKILPGETHQQAFDRITGGSND